MVVSQKSERLRSRKWLDHVKSFPCCVCGGPACDPHHLRVIGHPRAMSMKNSDDMCIPLCRAHHDEVHAFGDEALWLALNGIDPEEELRKIRVDKGAQEG